MDKQLIDGGNLDILDQTKIHSHADFAQVVHGLFAANFFGCAQDTQRPTHVVMQILSILAHQKIASPAFVFD
jgi:hypothetical protein